MEKKLLQRASTFHTDPRLRATSSGSLSATSDKDRIPPGLIGARVQQLASIVDRGSSLPTLSLHNPSVPTLGDHERASETLGWGRRIDTTFAKPANRNVILLEDPPTQHNYHLFVAPVIQRVQHQEEHGHTKSSVQNPASRVGKRQTSATPRHLPPVYVMPTVQNPFHRRRAANTTESHYHRTIATTRPRSALLDDDRSFSSLGQSNETRLTTDPATRQRDAREIFQDYGISRPQGWLSEDDSSVLEGHSLSAALTWTDCHLCRNRLSTERRCENCGHEACCNCPMTQESLQEERWLSIPMSEAPQPAETITMYRERSRDHVQDQHSLETPPMTRSTPKTRVLRAGPSIPEENEELFLDKSTQTTDAQEAKQLRAAGLVRANPFLLMDLGRRPKELKPQLTSGSAEAYRPSTRHSDYVPGRDLGKSSEPEGHGRCSNPWCQATHKGHHPIRHSTKCTEAREAQSDYDHQGDAAESAFKYVPEQRVHEDRYDSLEGKISHLQKHAQDLYHSQHILEHLAVGSKALNANTSTFPRDHQSVTEPRSEAMSQSENYGLHDIDNDVEVPTSRPPTHDLYTDDIVATRRATLPEHDISRDQVTPLSQPPAVHELSQDVLSKVEGWSRFHRLEGARPTVNKHPGKVKAVASRMSWLDRPEKLPPHEAHFPGRDRLESTKTIRGVQQEQATSIAEESRLSQKRLRKVSRAQTDSTQERPSDTSTADISRWREQLRSVPKSEQEQPPTPRISQVSRRDTCLFCDHVTTATSTQPGSRPRLETEDVKMGRCQHVGMSSADSEPGLAHEHTQKGQIEVPIGKVNLDQVDKSLLRQAAHLTQQHPTPSAAALPPRQHETTDTEVCHPPGEAQSVIEHQCSWRKRFMDLSTEVEAMREMGKQQPAVAVSIGPPPPPPMTKIEQGRGQANLGVMSVHNCEDYGIEGLTIVMHMKGKDDLVINTDLTRESSLHGGD